MRVCRIALVPWKSLDSDGSPSVHSGDPTAAARPQARGDLDTTQGWTNAAAAAAVGTSDSLRSDLSVASLTPPGPRSYAPALKTAIWAVKDVAPFRSVSLTSVKTATRAGCGSALPLPRSLRVGSELGPREEPCVSRCTPLTRGSFTRTFAGPWGSASFRVARG